MSSDEVVAAAWLVALLSCTCWVLITSTRAAAVATIGTAVIWILVNGPLEGPVLLVLTPHHGITLSDLLSVVATLVALHSFLPRRPG